MTLVRIEERAKDIGYLEDISLVTSLIDDTGEGTWIHASIIRPEDWRCPECNRKALNHGNCQQIFVDVPYQGRPTKLNVKIPRGKCRNNGCHIKTFQFRPPDFFDGKMTARCRRYIENNCFKQTFTALAKQTWVPEATIRRIADKLLNKLDRDFRIDTPRVLSIDEIYLPSGKDEAVRAENRENFPQRKSKIPRTIISDGETSQVVEVLPDVKGDTLFRYLIELQGFERIELVTMDLSGNFRQAVEAAFGDRVTIIADRWHVSKIINEVVDDNRKRVRPDQMEGAREHKLNLTTRSYILKDKSPEKYKNLMDFLNCTPDLKGVYWLKEALLDIYSCESRAEAEAGYETWLESLNDSQRDEFKPVIRNFHNWRDEIFSYWDGALKKPDSDPVADIDPAHPVLDYIVSEVGLERERHTNARAEARNRQIRHLNRAGRSYSFRFLRARAIFSTYDVWKYFDNCELCSMPFRREVALSDRQLEKARAALARKWGFNQKFLCRDCEARYFGTTESGEKPVQSIATRCGLADIWTERETSIRDVRELYHAAVRRRRTSKLLPDSYSDVQKARAQPKFPEISW